MHWARWGDPARVAPLSAEVRALLDAAVGTRETPAVSEEEVRLADPLPAPLVEELAGLVGAEQVATDPGTRLRRTRGRSTTDLLAVRRGDGADAPGAVVRPEDHDEVLSVLRWATERRVAVVPFGGGTSVVGGLAAAGSVCLDLSRLDALVDVDEESMTAVLQAGVRGPRAEALLAEHGLTLGHFPQSFEYATIGGFAATRSSGQASAGYGRFDQMVVGLTAATSVGTWELGDAPATAAGPDLRQLLLGSEGAFGVLTSVRVRVRPRPEDTTYEHWRFASFDAGRDAVRRVAQSALRPTVLRLSDETETAVNLADPSGVGGQSIEGGGGCLAVVGYEGSAADVSARRTACAGTLRAAGGQYAGEDTAWARGRFDGPYLRDALLDAGVLVETCETVAPWSRLRGVYDAVLVACAEQLPGSVVLCHVSHVYETGASLYFTVAAAQDDDPEAQWRRAKSAVTEAMVTAGASVTHHHAVGRDHRPWLEREIGPIGVRVLRAVKAELDPAGILNPGVLLP